MLLVIDNNREVKKLITSVTDSTNCLEGRFLGVVYRKWRQEDTFEMLDSLYCTRLHSVTTSQDGIPDGRRLDDLQILHAASGSFV